MRRTSPSEGLINKILNTLEEWMVPVQVTKIRRRVLLFRHETVVVVSDDLP